LGAWRIRPTMNMPQEQSVEEVIRSLVEREPIKVWSWLTTIFGDLAQQSGDELSSMMLGELTESIGIRPQAMRVALHRLRKDGWITARKEGRGSHYRLTHSALVETLDASERIYSRQIPQPDGWHVLILSEQVRDTDHVVATPRSGEVIKIADATFLGMGKRPQPKEGIISLDIPFDEIPNWVTATVIHEELLGSFERFADLLTSVERVLERREVLPCIQRITLRLLTLHHWRRAVLRCPHAVELLAGESWIGAECRRRCMRLLDTLTRADFQLTASDV